MEILESRKGMRSNQFQCSRDLLSYPSCLVQRPGTASQPSQSLQLSDEEFNCRTRFKKEARRYKDTTNFKLTPSQDEQSLCCSLNALELALRRSEEGQWSW